MPSFRMAMDFDWGHLGEELHPFALVFDMGMCFREIQISPAAFPEQSKLLAAKVRCFAEPRQQSFMPLQTKWRLPPKGTAKELFPKSSAT